MDEEAAIIERFQELLRGTDRALLDFLPPFEHAVTIPETATVVRTHFLAHDTNGSPVVEQLAGAMADAAVDFCIPRQKIERAFAECVKTGTTAPLVNLNEQARDLFVKSTTSGEGGELLLFLFLERVLKRPQLISKMPLKTSSAMHVHGSDGIHASLADDGVLDIYWGESKLYQSSSAAFKDCLESIAPFLRADEVQARKRDLLLVRDHLNVPQVELAAHLLEYFDESSSKNMQVRWNGVCLVGFDHTSYPNVQTLDGRERKALADQVGRWHTSVGNRVREFELVAVNIDLFCIPMPNVNALRTRVLERMGVK